MIKTDHLTLPLTLADHLSIQLNEMAGYSGGDWSKGMVYPTML
jgi:hypothetical protein